MDIEQLEQSGFTLIEVLVAVVILALGLLGLAGLQTYGLQSNHSADSRTHATLLSYDIIDRIRANRAAFDAGNYDRPNPANFDCSWLDANNDGVDDDDGDTDGTNLDDCTPAEMARHDVWEWNSAVSRALPRGIGVVCLDSTPSDDTDGDGNQDEGFGDQNNNDSLDSLSEHGCDGAGSTYVVKIWWADEFDRDPNSNTYGQPIIKRFVTTFQP